MINRALLRSLPRIGGLRQTSSLVQKFDNAVGDLPMREAVRYKNGNVKVTANDLKKWSEAHANALLEMGVTAGDTIVVWFPECAEKHVEMLAAAKIGAKIADFSYDMSSVDAVRQALAAAKGRVVVFANNKGEDLNDDKLLLLRKSIPEFYYYDDTHGQQFHSKHFPDLQYFVHTGHDGERGALQFKTLFTEDAPTNPIAAHTAKHTADHTPLYTRFGKQGETTATLTHQQVVEGGAWPFLNKLLTKEYFEC